MHEVKEKREESGSLCHAGYAAVVLSLHLATKAQQCSYHMVSFKCDSLLCDKCSNIFFSNIWTVTQLL